MLIKNLGPIKELEIHLNKQNILLGKNNTGKTYVSYLIYGLYKKIDSLKNEIFKDFIQKRSLDNKSALSFKVNKEDLINFYKVEYIAYLQLL